jgi:hypothetical protein
MHIWINFAQAMGPAVLAALAVSLVLPRLRRIGRRIRSIARERDLTIELVVIVRARRGRPPASNG